MTSIAAKTHDGELTSINPATLEEVGRIAVTTSTQLNGMVDRAHRAFRQWRTDRDLRQNLLTTCSDELMRRSEEIAPLLTREQGKPLIEARGEVWIAAQSFAEAARITWEAEATAEAAPGRTAVIERRPFGVIAAIVPWNFPVFLTAAKIAPALAAGNTAIVKPAESVSLVISKVVEILQAVLPDDVLAVAVGGPGLGRALVEHPKVRKVSFTGSKAVGTQVMEQAAQTITPVTLELGGNDPAILLADADIDAAAASLAKGAFLNAGQMCIAPKRAYVPQRSVDRFCEAFAAAAELTVGDGLDPATEVGPLHNRAQWEIVENLLQEARSAGATVVAGGGRGTDLPGHFFEPTVVRNVDDTMDLVVLEQFGPVFPVVGYADLDVVLDTVDSQEFGLGASVWSADVDSATAVATRIDAGTVWVNQHNALEVGLPFGGVKSSGFGREGGVAGVEDFLRTRVLNIRL